jgi:hypothetical protein
MINTHGTNYQAINFNRIPDKVDHAGHEARGGVKSNYQKFTSRYWSPPELQANWNPMH